MIFFNPFTCQFVKKQALLSENLKKTSIKFHVPSLTKWQKVLLIFKNIGRSITDENSFHLDLSQHCFSKHCSFTKISSKFL